MVNKIKIGYLNREILLKLWFIISCCNKMKLLNFKWIVHLFRLIKIEKDWHNIRKIEFIQIWIRVIYKNQKLIKFNNINYSLVQLSTHQLKKLHKNKVELNKFKLNTNAKSKYNWNRKWFKNPTFNKQKIYNN